MYETVETNRYRRWFQSLRDGRARERIDTRLRRLRLGNFGDSKPVSGGVSELRVDYGPGYRVYYAVQERRVVILLAGGDKSSQAADIEVAQRLWQSWKDAR
jgi:putative addiction module killer protein